MSDTLLVSTRKGLFTVSRRAGQWEITAVDFLGDNVTLTLTDRRDGRTYAALDHGHFGVKLHRSTANGWEEMPAPAYPPKPDGYEENDMWGRPLNWSTARIWALAAGGADEPGVLWCGTLPGGLFRSTDHGQSWEMARALWDHPKRKQWMGGGADLPGIHSICVDPRNSRRVWVGVSTGGIWFTEDAGASWALRGEGMRAEYAPPEQTHDPDRPGRPLSGAMPGGARAHVGAAPQRHLRLLRRGQDVHRDQRRRAVDVRLRRRRASAASPTRRGSFPRSRTRSASRARASWWSRARATAARASTCCPMGLPQSHAYDVVYRHALALDEAGDRLAFGSTTGGLWVSEDQGDSWAGVTHTLPPVYAVRFA